MRRRIMSCCCGIVVAGCVAVACMIALFPNAAQARGVEHTTVVLKVAFSQTMRQKLTVVGRTMVNVSIARFTAITQGTVREEPTQALLGTPLSGIIHTEVTVHSKTIGKEAHLLIPSRNLCRTERGIYPLVLGSQMRRMEILRLRETPSALMQVMMRSFGGPRTCLGMIVSWGRRWTLVRLNGITISVHMVLWSSRLPTLRC